jgi:hypothetical protein
MRPFAACSSICAAYVAALLMPAVSGAEPPKVDYNRDIRPLLSRSCYACHGPDEAERQAGLRLDTQEGAVAELESGARAVVAGDAAASELLARVASTDEATRMPPSEVAAPLKPEQIDLLKRWIEEGATFAAHWSFTPPARPKVPAIAGDSSRAAIDALVLDRLAREGLSPAPEADKYALVRRVTLDLTGLPPTIEEVDRFVANERASAYEELVDRLLASPAYGERWGRVWLDLARYADSAGYADDPERTIWRYRDWVISAVNSNMPFDRFTAEQLAGDLLPNPTADQLLATAFHRNTMTNSEGGTDDEEFRVAAVVDRVNTTMTVWMGLTMGCAQCHTHKYDPITQEEYYRFLAFFNNTADADRRDETPVIPAPTFLEEFRRASLVKQIEEVEREIAAPHPELAEGQSAWEASLAAPIAWSWPSEQTATSTTGASLAPQPDGSLLAGGENNNGEHRVRVRLDSLTLAALRLEVLSDPSLPGGGPGRGADGRFVLSRIAARYYPQTAKPPSGRYLRIELPGENKILSLAEVQAFSGADNVARQGVASQSSVAFNGPAALAIDGNSDGRYFEAKSTTHTNAENNPWWEVDFGADRQVDRVAIFNRTDTPEIGERLKDFRVLLLKSDRQPVWQTTVTAAPKPSSELDLSGARDVALIVAQADLSRENQSPSFALTNDDLAKKGWSIPPAAGRADPVLATAVFSPAASGEDWGAGELEVVLEHVHETPGQTLGRFRLAITSDVRAQQKAALPGDVAAILETAPAARSQEQSDRLAAYYKSIAPELAPQRAKLADLQKQLAAITPATAPIMQELAGDARRQTHVMIRGNFLDKGAAVTEGVPAAFHPWPEGVPMNRLGLARWLVDEANPLTARVTVNRLWEQLFGIGLVETSEDFGIQGEPPSHPELLDWLATELIRRQWDVKAIVRTIVTSAAYRRSAEAPPDQFERDPNNRLLARGPRFRLDAEVVRDQALAASGLLSRKMYGPSAQPPRPALGLNAAFGGSTDWTTSPGEDRFRRGLYTSWRRSAPYPSMATFDAPNREVCTVRRIRTNTPLQALVTMNDPVYVEASQALGRRMASEGGAGVAEKAAYGFRLCVARPPTEAEAARLAALYEEALARFQATPEEAMQMATDPLGPLPQGASAAEMAAWTVVANVLLNLDETIARR